MKRYNIHDVGSGCSIGTGVAGVSILLENNYIHDLRSGLYDGENQSHNGSTTIRAFAGKSLILRNNNLECLTGTNSGTVFIQANGYIKGATIEGNLFNTYGYCVPLEANAKGYGVMRTINNRFMQKGFGPGYVSGGEGWSEWSRNYYYDPEAEDGKGEVIDEP